MIDFAHIKKARSLIIVLVSVSLMFVGCWYYFTHNKSYENDAIEKCDYVYLNGVQYIETSYEELGSYTISNVIICKTDRGMILYEIEQYPDYEYIAGYQAWDGQIFKRVD
ncbi:MAG: hypothetical protein LKE53_00005 [Oscillospiraceae bacterium]|jgi:hypothetical protein|nr:hypothetical protein [Oscillospiraceae bacterium]